jgi:hypothetical protein
VATEKGALMLALNSVILEGKFLHYTTKKGELPLKFVLENNGQTFGVSVEGKMAEVFINSVSKKQMRGLRIVGKLERIGHTVSVKAEHIEFKPMQTYTKA